MWIYSGAFNNCIKLTNCVDQGYLIITVLLKLAVTVVGNMLADDIPRLSVGQFMLHLMKTFDEREALVDASTDLTYTYNELITRTERAAAGLQKLGVCKNDVVCIIAPNNLDYVVTFYATTLISGIFKPINPLHTEDELKRTLEECNAKFVFTVPALLPKTQKSLPDSKIKILTYGDVEGFMSFESLLDPVHGDYTCPPCDPRTDVAALLSSSGTTGFPKHVKVTHYAIVANILQLNHLNIVSGEDTYVTFMPLFHMYGLYVITADVHSVGGKVVLMSKFNPDEYLKLLQKHKPRTLHVVPPIMVMLAKYPKVSEYDLSSVYKIYCGAAPLSQEIEEAVTKRLTHVKFVFQGYGMTEVGCTMSNTDQSNKYKSVGRLLPLVEMKIMDVETGDKLGYNKEGELWFRGPQCASGYLNLSQETSQCFVEESWIRTGDIGYEDEDGFVYIVDRLKELIKYKGFQVPPATLEDILLRHDAIADAAVIGVPDECAGELPRAYVVKKAGKDVSEEDIVQFVSDLVAPHMKLRGGVEFVTEVPRTSSGKILRKTLREQARASVNNE